ncbi:putative ABC transport system permease protein [Chitinophaga jiangningensis]|uniref:Putative ABC transport system permease protein n=1 Tax=Chitinophaga jiangningensis TaxID=1419482 RepID=A0A1M7LSI0_9BACT|nr:ABC transporter permease [Chitinophaga jiangningensis]SHM81116.1 putative ABC transport system permease protein [Chitinophaga jiangningensis]
MLKNYFKIAWRNLWKHRLFSLINIIGLGLAMAMCLLIIIQLQGSFERDAFHPFPDRTYRITTDVTAADGKTISLASTPQPLAQKLEQEQSSVEGVAQVIRGFGGTFSNRVKSLGVWGHYVSPGYFKLFNFPLEKGQPATAPYTVVLSHETAAKFFGDTDPIGKTLEQKDLGTFTITGVFAPLGQHVSHLDADIVVSMATYPMLHPGEASDNWLNYNAYTYVLLHKGTTPEQLNGMLAQVRADNRKQVDFTGVKDHQFHYQRIGSISPDFSGLQNNPGVEPWFKILINGIMVLIIISLAIFNYINLTLTRSLSRAREVGVRKVAGAARWQLVLQFLIESVLIAMFALVIGMVGLYAMKSFIHARWLIWEVQRPGILWCSFLGFTLLTGLVAGAAPARILSAAKPVAILKGALGPAGFGKIGLRKALIVVQFVVSLVFMVSTAIMYTQFRYMATDNKNFNRKDILNIPIGESGNYRLLANEIAKLSGVNSIGATSAPLNESAGRATITRDARAKAGIEPLQTFTYSVDAAFIRNMKLTFAAGNNLPESKMDTSKGRFVVLNEKAVQSLGFTDPQASIGQTILLDSVEMMIAGVVKNFNFMRYEMPVTPLVLRYDPAAFTTLSLLVQKGTHQEALTASIQSTWKRLFPYEPFLYNWYEQQLYEDYMENEDLKLFGIIILIVFVIASLGMLGVVTHSTEKRAKEVVIRKVMGAGIIQVMRLLSWSFVKLMIIAAAIGLPLGALLGALFLHVFTYHATPGISIYLVCLGSLACVGALTIGIQVYRIALLNPALALRQEG